MVEAVAAHGAPCARGKGHDKLALPLREMGTHRLGKLVGKEADEGTRGAMLEEVDHTVGDTVAVRKIPKELRQERDPAAL